MKTLPTLCAIASLLTPLFAAVAAPPVKDLPGLDKLPAVKELPDPFTFDDGSRVQSPADWPRRRAEILETILAYQYGHLPPAPDNVKAVELISTQYRAVKGSTRKQFKISCGPDAKVSFVLDLTIPAGKGPFPVILRGDWCWGKVSDEITQQVLQRGYILAEFNRCEIAPDNKNRDTGLYVAYPDSTDTGAIAAWAWGYHRCVDVLSTLDVVNKEQITITGHSRGGKATLLAGATDPRIALTVPNNSGCGGAGSYKFQAPKSEDAKAISRSFPFWFSPRYAQFIDHQDQMPFDQHFVKALVAPRGLLTTEALGDLWANPEGTRQTHLAAKEVYTFLGAPDKIGIFYRPGGHEHGLDDWTVLLDYADQLFKGKKSDRDFNPKPFPDTPKTFSWTAPASK